MFSCKESEGVSRVTHSRNIIPARNDFYTKTVYNIGWDTTLNFWGRITVLWGLSRTRFPFIYSYLF